jgi:hypothetical protein
MANKVLKEAMYIEDGFVVIVKKIAPRPSKAGKSMLLATTSGTESFSHEDKSVLVNLNVYVPNVAKG